MVNNVRWSIDGCVDFVIYILAIHQHQVIKPRLFEEESQLIKERNGRIAFECRTWKWNKNKTKTRRKQSSFIQIDARPIDNWRLSSFIMVIDRRHMFFHNGLT